MEFAACLTGGLGLMICGMALFSLRPPNWKNDGELLEIHRTVIERWALLQRIVRWLNNLMLIVIGGLIAATAFVPHGQVWMLLWSVILLLLLVAILFAMVDAFSSLAGYRRALPEAARRSFSRQELRDIAQETKQQ
jgi:hypothetical protein